MKRIKTKKVLHNLGNEYSEYFKMNTVNTFWHYHQGPYLEPNQNSIVELFAKIVNDF